MFDVWLRLLQGHEHDRTWKKKASMEDQSTEQVEASVDPGIESFPSLIESKLIYQDILLIKSLYQIFPSRCRRIYAASCRSQYRSIARTSVIEGCGSRQGEGRDGGGEE
jgi:hypothetical protein